MLNYLATLSTSRKILWGYLVWWLVMVTLYFSPEPRLWSTSLGIALVVGYALMLSTGPVNSERFVERFWESMRLFICPFLVSSFSALIVGKGFFLVFSPLWYENALAAVGIGIFLLICRFIPGARPKADVH